MIIGISGAQGQGKSTLIKEAVKINPSLFDNYDAQTARQLLGNWGYTLAEVNAYIPLKIRFQNKLLENHKNLLLNLKSGNDNKCFLVERTFADIFVYALLSVGVFNEYSEWVNEYCKQCLYAQRLFDTTIFLSGREYVPEEDNVRSTNIHFSSAVDILIKQYTFKFGIGAVDITEPLLDKRVEVLTNLAIELRGNQ